MLNLQLSYFPPCMFFLPFFCFYICSLVCLSLLFCLFSLLSYVCQQFRFFSVCLFFLPFCTDCIYLSFLLLLFIFPFLFSFACLPFFSSLPPYLSLTTVYLHGCPLNCLSAFLSVVQLVYYSAQQPDCVLRSTTQWAFLAFQLHKLSG